MIEDSGGRAKVLDFGLAKLATRDDAETVDDGEAETVTPEMAAELTTEGVIVGSPGYMSPEQLHGKPVDARTDTWAFGVLLYELLAGRRPFSNANQVALVVAICTEDLPPLGRDDIPAALTTLVQRCLAKKPEGRPADGAALVEALGALDGSRNAPAPETSEMATAPTVASDAASVADAVPIAEAVAVADTVSVAVATPVTPSKAPVIIGVVAALLSAVAIAWISNVRLGDDAPRRRRHRPWWRIRRVSRPPKSRRPRSPRACGARRIRGSAETTSTGPAPRALPRGASPQDGASRAAARASSPRRAVSAFAHRAGRGTTRPSPTGALALRRRTKGGRA